MTVMAFIPAVTCAVCRKVELMPCSSYSDTPEGFKDGNPSGLPHGWIDHNRSEFLCSDCQKGDHK